MMILRRPIIGLEFAYTLCSADDWYRIATRVMNKAGVHVSYGNYILMYHGIKFAWYLGSAGTTMLTFSMVMQ